MANANAKVPKRRTNIGGRKAPKGGPDVQADAAQKKSGYHNRSNKGSVGADGVERGDNGVAYAIQWNDDTRSKLVGLGEMMATTKECAGFLQVDEVTFLAFEQRHPEAKELRIGAQQMRKISLRRRQFQAADAGDKTMLVWLGKQYLEQKDRAETSQAVTLDVKGVAAGFDAKLDRYLDAADLGPPDAGAGSDADGSGPDPGGKGADIIQLADLGPGRATGTDG